VNNEQVAEAVTDHDGQAVVSCNLPRSKAESFVAKTQVGKETAETQGTIFRWSNDKTIVAVDIDETISKTDYSGLFFVHVDRHSKPIGNSRDILEGMTKDYQIYYFSARPRFLHEKTKQWLKENRFPPGPVAHASKFEACLHQQTYKRKMLEELRERYPNMLVGIGDKGVDDKAFGANQMVTVLVNYSRLDRYSSRCVLCKDWNQVNQFFTTHRRQLVNPQNALAAIDDDTDMNTPVLVGEPTGPSTSN
jgi:phosphatidate phosphatase APP1